MDDDLNDCLEFLDRVFMQEENAHKIPKRYLRDREDPFNFFLDVQFNERFRFTKEVTKFYIFPLIEDKLKRENNRGLPVPAIIQLLICLRFYASGSYQKIIADIRGFSQATICRCIRSVSIRLAEEFYKFVDFPREISEQICNIRKFYEIAGFPNVAACIDGTLIKIACPAKAVGEIFRSRKGYFALNVLAACGPRREIVAMDVRHPGSTHDSTCFDRSALKMLFEERRIKGLLLGDNGYACKPYLLTPILHPLNTAERKFNKCHIKTRNLIERTFGGLKSKFSCLKRGLLNHLDLCIAIICAIAVLWNIHININYPHTCGSVDNENEEPYLEADPPDGMNGLDYRHLFINRHFL